MMQDILQQFAGGAPNMPPEQMYGHVNTMLQQAPAEHVRGAIGDALQGLGPQGFGQSVQQAAQTMGPQQQQGLFGMLGQAIEGGGGSLPNVLGSLGLGGSNPGSTGGGYASGGGMSMPQGLGAGGLGQLASYALQNHSSALTSVLGNQLGGGATGGIGGMLGGGSTGGGGSAGVLSLLGNPTVQRVGMGLAQRLLSGGGL